MLVGLGEENGEGGGRVAERGRGTGETLTRGMGTDCGRKDLRRGVRRPVSV